MWKIVVHAPFLGNIAGITLYPFILLKHKAYKKDKFLMNHEEIHLQQQKELLVLPFYLLYVGNYCYNLIKYKDRHQAYLNICFEREAYQNDYELDYLKKRKLFAFWKYW
ncbi:hypothetical protein AD998_17065 [bacterium 336/3]|nr:hypothetical protein AD998_17065 [bacterium 336/3]